MVQQSREKAKEMHSSLAMQAARKVQRENGVDMSEIIKFLRAEGIGAASASDPRGLDAVVAEAIDAYGPGGLNIPSAERPEAAGASGAYAEGGAIIPSAFGDPSEPRAAPVRREGAAVQTKKRQWGEWQDPSAPRAAPARREGAAEAKKRPARRALRPERAARREAAAEARTAAGASGAAEELGRQKEAGPAGGVEAASAESEAQSRLWGCFGDEWHKCVLLKVTKSGGHKVEWTDGTTSTLDAEHIRPRVKKARRD